MNIRTFVVVFAIAANILPSIVWAEEALPSPVVVKQNDEAILALAKENALLQEKLKAWKGAASLQPIWRAGTSNVLRTSLPMSACRDRAWPISKGM